MNRERRDIVLPFLRVGLNDQWGNSIKKVLSESTFVDLFL